MLPSSRFVIVWDLDNTVGDFSALHQHGECPTPIAVRVRPGVREALQVLSDAGFVHTLLTLATPLYAEMVLRATDLRSFFARVEGFGQRGKGDAAGIGAAFGIPPRERPHRMIFVGDHPLFDEPRDERVVFHLEPCALTRPADELARLVLGLREAGQGSFRGGFERWLVGNTWWKRWRWLRALFPASEPTLVAPEGIGELLLVERRQGCPIIGFADLPLTPGLAREHSFVPAELSPRVRADLGP